jgi:cell division protein FtsX
MSNTNEGTWIGVLGTIIATVLSWTKWHAFWWMILHGLLGWLYVIWYFVKGY